MLLCSSDHHRHVHRRRDLRRSLPLLNRAMHCRQRPPARPPPPLPPPQDRPHPPHRPRQPPYPPLLPLRLPPLRHCHLRRPPLQKPPLLQHSPLCLLPRWPPPRGPPIVRPYAPPGPVSHNTMISTLTHHGHHREALDLFTQMRKDHSLDKFTVVGVATACAYLGALESLRQLHGAAIVAGLELNLIMSNVMIDAYRKCGDAGISRKLFDRMETRDVISWTSLVVAYASAHRLQEAWLAFDQMPERNAVSWTALISGYEQNGEGEALIFGFPLDLWISRKKGSCCC